MPLIPPTQGSYNPDGGYNAQAEFQPATASTVGVRGHVPGPPIGTPADYVLRADGTWGAGGGPAPPSQFNATLVVAYTPSSLPYYNSTQLVPATRTLTVFGTATAIAGTISDGTTTVNVTTAGTAVTVALLNTGLTIGGTCTGTGADTISRTITFSGSVPAVTIYTPAFYAQTATSTPPTFTTSSTATAGNAQGSTITYPIATASTNYNWICTQRPLSSLILVTAFGNSVLVPDVTAPTQTIAGQVFSVYGWSFLATTVASVLQVN